MAGNLTAMIAAAFSGGAAPPVTSDPYFEYTTLLLPGNGTNGAQNNTFLDGSTNNFTITRNGNTTQGTFSPFSQTGWGNYFNGSSDYLSLSDNTAFNFGTGDATVEFWFNSPGTSSNYPGIISSVNYNTAGSASIRFDNTGYKGKAFMYLNGGGDPVISSTSTLSYNTWYHVAITRSGTSLKMYINGTLDTTVTISASLGWYLSYGGMRIGRGFDVDGAGGYFPGYISNIRLVKGVAVYTGNFTPPTTPLAATQSAGTNISAITGTQTSLLTCQSNRFIDNSSNNFTITRNGDTRVVAFSPFNPSASWSAATYGGSGYFDGSGDYLQIQNSNDFDTNTAFTLECWVYTNSNGCMFARGGGGASWSTTNGHQFIFYINSGVLRWQFNSGGSPVTLDSSAIQLNSWVHCAVGYNGTTTRLWLNGVSAATSTSSYTMPTTRNIVQSGVTASSDQPYTGYISGLRFVKSDVYGVGNTTFTPPTAPLTAITNTSLLLSFTNAGIHDATSKNDLETVGNAQISTTQSKWGGSSMYFDGTGDYLYDAPTPFIRLGTGDFTIECWVRFNNVTAGTTQGIFQIADSYLQASLTNNGVGVTTTSGTGWLFYAKNNQTYNFSPSVPPAANTWMHIALVRYSGTTKLYVSGTGDASLTAASDTTNYTATYLALGGVYGGNALNGYIQDFRITVGVARYTANFTPPTAAFPTL